MARNTLTPQVAGPAGIQISWTALNADGHQAVMKPGSKFLIKNGATAFGLTIPTTQTIEGLAVDDRDIAIDGAEDYAVRLPDIGPYIQANGMVWFDYDNTDDGEVAVIE
jgi:hypothetical protein